MLISPQNGSHRATSHHRQPRKFGVTIRVLLGSIAGFILWQKNGPADYFAYTAAESLIPNLDAPAVQYAVMSFVVVLGFSAWMSLMVMTIFIITSAARSLLSRLFFSQAGLPTFAELYRGASSLINRADARPGRVPGDSSLHCRNGYRRSTGSDGVCLPDEDSRIHVDGKMHPSS